jgi:hypothetical protein
LHFLSSIEDVTTVVKHVAVEPVAPVAVAVDATEMIRGSLS